MVKYVKIRLEDEIHLEFRKMCLEAGTNMQQRLTDLIVRDIQERKGKKQSIEDEGHEETNGHHVPQQVKVAKPRKHHKIYKDKVGELVTELAGNQVKVSFDGEAKAFYSDELELVGTE